MTFDPDIYTITIRKETVDGETCYVGSVAEFQNVSAYEDTYDAALAIIRDVLTTIAMVAKEKGQQLPAPRTESDEIPSGRITLRMPRSLHAKVIRRAEVDETSANQIINIAVAEYLSQISTAEKATEIIRNAVEMNIATIHVTRHDTYLPDVEEAGAWYGKPHVKMRAPSRVAIGNFDYQRNWNAS